MRRPICSPSCCSMRGTMASTSKRRSIGNGSPIFALTKRTA